MHWRFGTITPARSKTEASSNTTVSLFSNAFLSIVYISFGNSAVGSGVQNGFTCIVLVKAVDDVVAGSFIVIVLPIALP